MKTVIFACVHNAGRSQMAAAWFNALVDPSKARALSAGTEPAARVHPEVLAIMREVGIDLSTATPQLLTAALASQADALITMGCGEACPVVPRITERLDWQILDPKGKTPAEVRAIRDAIKALVGQLIDSHGWAAAR